MCCICDCWGRQEGEFGISPPSCVHVTGAPLARAKTALHCDRNWGMRGGAQGANHAAVFLRRKNVPSTNVICASLRNAVPQ